MHLERWKLGQVGGISTILLLSEEKLELLPYCILIQLFQINEVPRGNGLLMFLDQANLLPS
jgi:hypothetical protein